MLKVHLEEQRDFQVFEFAEPVEDKKIKEGNSNWKIGEIWESRVEMTDFCCSEPEQRVSRNFYRGAHATLVLFLCQFVVYLQSLHLKLQMCQLRR